jgi:hypothetical protein
MAFVITLKDILLFEITEYGDSLIQDNINFIISFLNVGISDGIVQ